MFTSNTSLKSLSALPADADLQVEDSVEKKPSQKSSKEQLSKLELLILKQVVLRDKAEIMKV